MLFESQEIFKNDSGIYKIINNVNGKFYIGSASNFLNRYKEHLSALKNNRHYNDILQRSFNKHGKEAYAFIVLEITTGKSKKERLDTEDIYLKKYYDCGKMCYNLTFTAYSREGSTSKNPESTKSKMSAVFRERSKNIDYIKRKSDSAKRTWGLKDYRDKMIQIANSEEAIQRFKINCKNKLSIEKMAFSKAKYWGKIISPIGVVHDVTNLSRFCKENNLHKPAMIAVFNGKSYQCLGWRLYDEKLIDVVYSPEEHRLAKEFIVIGPDNIEHKGKNLKEFCRKNNLSQSNMHAVINGKNKSYKGWHVLATETMSDKKEHSLSKEFKFLSPDGIIYEGKNLCDFCRKHNLSQSNMHCVLKGIYKQHKGWRLPDNNKTQY